jgi:hypothetical protein
MVAFGAGLTWAAAVVKWSAPVPTVKRTIKVSKDAARDLQLQEAEV